MKKIVLALIGLLILIQPKGIYAEEEKYGKVFELGQITVTASRIERNLSEVSSYVNIISEKKIRESNAKNVPDLLKNLEGVYMYDSSGVGTTGRVNMRGFWGGMSTHQLVLVDGVPQNKGKDKLLDWDLIPLDNIERIEIVKGPNSALYGDNAMSGVINIITKVPSAADGVVTKVSSSYGNFNTQNYTISASGVLLDKHNYYLSASRKSTDGFRRYCDYENMHINGKLDLLFGETQYLRLSSGYHDRKRGAFPWAITEAQIEEDRRQARPGTENDKEDAYKADASATYHKDFGKSSEIEVTSYYRYEDSGAFYTSGPTADKTKEQLQGEDTYGLILRLNTSPKLFGINKSITTGIDLERNEFDYREYAAPDQTRGAIRSDYGIHKDKIGPYIQDEISLLNPLKLILGLRYDLIKFDFTDHKDPSASKKKKMSGLTPKCGIVYAYKEYSNLYANYSQAFRSPTIGQMFAYGSYSNPDLNPEKATNYELGIRHLFNNYLKLSFSLYWMELDNEIWYDPDARQYKNYGKTSHKGIETGAELKFTKAFSGFLNYSYARAKNESGKDKGTYLSNIPLHKGSLGMILDTGYGLKANLHLTRLGSSYLDSANSDKLPEYTTLGISFRYEYKRLSTYLSIDNLFDEKYNSYGYKTSTGMKYFSPAPGRTFTLGVGIEF